MRNRLTALLIVAIVAIATGGADGCSSSPNIESAKLYLKQQEYEDALASLNTELEANPQSVEALTLKAEVLRTMGEKKPLAERGEIVPELVSTVNAATMAAPEDPEVVRAASNAWVYLITQGRNQMGVGDDGAMKSLVFLDAAVGLAPDSLASQFDLGRARLISGDAAGAIAPLERTVELDPGYGSGYLILSRAYLDQSRGAEAVELLERGREAVAEGEGRSEIQQAYLNTLAASGQLERAVSEFETQVADLPDDPLIRYNFGTLLLQSDRFEEAAAQFLVASELEPENADTQYNLGVAYLRQAGQVESAAGELDLSQEAEYDALIAERDELLDGSVAALEAARELASDGNRTTVCDALFRVYTAMGRSDDAAEAAECAGRSMN